MAGKGTECGKNIEEIKYLLDNVIFKNKIGVCLDTCHLNDSGVDIANFEDYLKEFDNLIGIDKIGCIHIMIVKILWEVKKIDMKILVMVI